MSTRSLLVVLSDRVSDWTAKGEIVERYLNPGDLFDEIHVVLMNDDEPDYETLKHMAGRASVNVHNVPAGRAAFVATLGWRPALARPWTRRVVALARKARPDLVRCHGVQLNAVAALAIRRHLGVPYVVSLHINPDVDHLRSARSGVFRHLAGRLVEPAERAALRGADVVLPVYESIEPYLRRLGVERFEVAYNVVGHGARARTDWSRGPRLHAVTVSRQTPVEKDPRPIIEAVAAIPDVELTVVGDGPLSTEVAKTTDRLGVSDRVHLTGSMSNDQVLALLTRADVFVYRSELYEVSKAVIEASLTALPIIVNDRGGEPAPELTGGHVLLVDGSAESYREALLRLRDDAGERERLGRAAFKLAERRWDPTVTEGRIAAIYERLLSQRPGGA